MTDHQQYAPSMPEGRDIQSLLYSAPQTVEEAVALLRQDEGARLIAGGGNLIVSLLGGTGATTRLVDVRHIATLRQIELADDHAFIGAGISFSELLVSPIAARFPALAKALRHVGTTAIRNRATLGGNIAWGDPRAEVPLVLMLHDAIVETTQRSIPLAEVPLAPLRTSLIRDEIILGVRVPLEPDPRGIRFLELLDRQSAGKAVVSVALRAAGDRLRFAVGGLFDRAVVADARRDGIPDAIDALERTVPALGDPFHSFAYRRAVAEVLLERALGELDLPQDNVTPPRPPGDDSAPA